jgi:hypothetical protein
MPYESEYAAYRPLHRIAESERVKELLGRSRVLDSTRASQQPHPAIAPTSSGSPPRFILAIDGSNAEVAVRNGYPGAKVGYCTVASVLIDLRLVEDLDKQRPVDPRKLRETEKYATIDAAFPGSNVVTRRQTVARTSFREEFYDHFRNVLVDEDDKIPLLDTYQQLLALKPKTHNQTCPYSDSDGCDASFLVPPGQTECPKCHRSIFSTDALRIHERYNDLGSNGEVFGLVMQVWERILLLHLLKCFERRGLLGSTTKLAFFLDGPLAVFGPPAWLSAAISYELKRINGEVRKQTGHDLLILGIEKSGYFVDHLAEIDETERPGEVLFSPGSYMLLTNQYIKERIQQSGSPKRFGMDTYFGRKFFYKTRTGARLVADLPFLSDEQDTLDSDDINLYPQFAAVCSLLDRLVSSRYPNALSPIVSAHAQAAIPLHLGAKVLQQLAKALMEQP